MAMKFEELDDKTRNYMLSEFELEEQSAVPYRSKKLTNGGKAIFPDLMRKAIKDGNEETLGQALLHSAYWHRTEMYVRAGIERKRQVDVLQASQRLALSEFNTSYVRGLSKRLMDENVLHCQAYRAQILKWEAADCISHDGVVFLVETIYSAHRARYWPEPGNRNAISIPFGSGCFHTIRRVP